MKLCDLIREYRKDHNLSQRQFASLCGLSNGYISTLEKGINPKTKNPVTPNLQQLKKLADGMDTTVIDLMAAISEMPSVGERIRERRKRLGISQTELAEMTSNSKQSIYKYERGIIANIPYDKVESIAQSLQTTPSYLMGWETECTSQSQSFIGQRIKARRKEIGVSAEELAHSLGVSPATIYRYENGDIDKVPSAHLKPIAESLQTTTDYLMGWSNRSAGTPDSPVTPGPSELDHREIGQRIKQRRTDLRLTLSDVSQAVGVTASTIQRYERGNFRKIKMPIIAAIAKTFSVDPAWLLGGIDGERDPITDSPANEHERDMLLLARRMGPIPEEDRSALIEQFNRYVDLYLKAKGFVV